LGFWIQNHWILISLNTQDELQQVKRWHQSIYFFQWTWILVLCPWSQQLKLKSFNYNKLVSQDDPQKTITCKISNQSKLKIKNLNNWKFISITKNAFTTKRSKNQHTERNWKYLKGSGGEFNTNSRFRLQTKLISRKPRENVGFTNTRISDQNDLEQVIILMIHPMRHRSSPLRSLTTYQIQSQNSFRSNYTPSKPQIKWRSRSNNSIKKEKKLPWEELNLIAMNRELNFLQ